MRLAKVCVTTVWFFFYGYGVVALGLGILWCDLGIGCSGAILLCGSVLGLCVVTWLVSIFVFGWFASLIFGWHFCFPRVGFVAWAWPIQRNMATPRGMHLMYHHVIIPGLADLGDICGHQNGNICVSLTTSVCHTCEFVIRCVGALLRAVVNDIL